MDKKSTPRAKALKANSLSTTEKENGENNSGVPQSESLQGIICRLENELTNANAEIVRLKAEMNEYESQSSLYETCITNQRSKLENDLIKANAEIVRLKAETNEHESQSNLYETCIANQRTEFLKAVSLRDNTIERKSMEIKILEQQLDKAVSAQFDALALLDAVKRKKSKESSDNATDQSSDAGSRSECFQTYITNADDTADNLEATSPQHLERRDVVAISGGDRENRRSGDDSFISVSLKKKLLAEMRIQTQRQLVLDAMNGVGMCNPSDSRESVNKQPSEKSDKKARIQNQSKSSKKAPKRSPVLKILRKKSDD